MKGFIRFKRKLPESGTVAQYTLYTIVALCLVAVVVQECIK